MGLGDGGCAAGAEAIRKSIAAFAGALRSKDKNQ